MSINGDGLRFHPLFWVHHDSWQFYVRVGGHDTVWNHWGHTHLFMPSFKWENSTSDAFSGFQTYKFETQDVWGPRSGDINQMLTYRVVGTPRWYFHVKELWRRIYIQPWDRGLELPEGRVVGRKGVRWDASARNKTFGPFREGRGFSPLFIDAGARTLPIEYYTSENKIQSERDNYVRDMLMGAHEGDPAFDPSLYIPPDSNYVPRGSQGGHDTYADGLYIHPIIEYQEVTQLDWERPPGWESTNDISDEDFGDGWQTELTIPFKDPITQQYRSPFSTTPGEVLPPGQYNEISFTRNGQVIKLVPDDRRLMNRERDFRAPDPESPNDRGGYDWRHQPFGLSEEESEQPTQFRDPYNKGDGRWVQQCLGGMIQARIRVTIEHLAYGKDSRQDIWITSTQYLPTAEFSGTDQKQPVPEE